MKIKLPKINFSKTKGVGRTEFSPQLERDWLIIVGLFFLLTFLLILLQLFNYWYFEIGWPGEGDKNLSNEELKNKLLDHAAYEDALSDIHDKEEKYKTYLITPPSLVDPSL